MPNCITLLSKLTKTKNYIKSPLNALLQCIANVKFKLDIFLQTDIFETSITKMIIYHHEEQQWWSIFQPLFCCLFLLSGRAAPRIKKIILRKYLTQVLWKFLCPSFPNHKCQGKRALAIQSQIPLHSWEVQTFTQVQVLKS